MISFLLTYLESPKVLTNDIFVVDRSPAPHDFVPLTIDLVALETKVYEKEAVVTSGLQQSVFPPEVPVGRVRRAEVAAGALQQQVIIDPVVDFRLLEYVKVLLWKPSG